MLLKIGSRGEQVKQLQEKLGLSADGVFGAGTQAAVKKWQARNGLIADGVVGQNTWGKLFTTKFDSKPIKKQETDEIATEITETIGPLNLQNLRGYIPDNVLAQIPETTEKFKIDTPIKLAHFLAQCGHESGNFRIVQENLNYSRQGLLRVFPRYFPGNLAESYEKKPEKIASRVYGDRMGNGPEPTKEGFKFRGRGYIQLTGKNNYVAFGDAINVNLVNNPDLVATKYPLLSAAWFFSKNCLNKCVDASEQTVKIVTRCVNGGQIGLEQRMKEFKLFYSLLTK
jgi:putative chitinase